MPTHRVSGRPGCYQWGKQKIYCGSGAKAKANKQGRAIRASESRRLKGMEGRLKHRRSASPG